MPETKYLITLRPGELADPGQTEPRPRPRTVRCRQPLTHQQTPDPVLAADPLRHRPLAQADQRLPLADAPRRDSDGDRVRRRRPAGRV